MLFVIRGVSSPKNSRKPMRRSCQQVASQMASAKTYTCKACMMHAQGEGHDTGAADGLTLECL